MVASLTRNDRIKTQLLIRHSLLSHRMRGTFHIIGVYGG
jgi:hypothetical protein